MLGFRLGQISAFDNQAEFSTFISHFLGIEVGAERARSPLCGFRGDLSLWPVMTKADSDCLRPDLRRLTLAPSKLSAPEFFASAIWARELRDFRWSQTSRFRIILRLEYLRLDD